MGEPMQEWVLQDSRSLVGDRLMFWAPGGGYTSDLDKAERYTKERAVAQNRCRESDLPWPLAYLEKHTETAVDCQYLKPEEVEAGLQATERSYVAAKGVWNGNDLYWLTDDGQVTANFAKAHAFPIGIARSMAKPGHHNVRAVPVALADSLARKVVPNGGVQIGIALRGAGVELAKPARPRSRSMRCGQCGVFISQYQVADCPKCRGSNYP